MITNKLNGLNVKGCNLPRYQLLHWLANMCLRAQRNKFDFFGRGDWYHTSYVGLQMRVPIFNGLSIRAKIKGAQLQLKKTENQAEALKNSIDKEVDDAKNNFVTAISTMDFQEEHGAC